MESWSDVGCGVRVETFLVSGTCDERGADGVAERSAKKLGSRKLAVHGAHFLKWG